MPEISLPKPKLGRDSAAFAHYARAMSDDNTPKSYSYEQAGVSIAAGNALVKAIAPLAKSTARPGADAELGGFGGFFDPRAAGYKLSLIHISTIIDELLR